MEIDKSLVAASRLALSRRGFLTGAAAALAMPAIGRERSLGRIAALVGGGVPAWASGADLWEDFSAANGNMADPTDTHAATIYMPNRTGVWIPKAANVLCRENGVGLQTVPTRTNSIRNNTMAGASAPSTLPTNWAKASGAGLTLSVEGTGTDAATGLTYVDIRLVGTTATNTNCDIRFDTQTATAATNGVTWTESAYIAIVGGSLANIGSIRLLGNQYDAGVVYLSSVTFVNPVVPTATLTRFSGSGATNNASIAYLGPQITLFYSLGVAIDITLRIAAPQMEVGAFASPPILTTSAAASVNGNQQVVDLTGRLGTGVAGLIQFTPKGVVSGSHILGTSDGVDGDDRSVLLVESGGNLELQVRNATVQQAAVVLGTYPAADALCTVAFATSENFVQGRIVGVSSVSADTVASYPTSTTKMGIGGAGFVASSNQYQITKKLALRFGAQDANTFDAMYARAVLAAAA